MANPQTENGYTKISNEILEALAKININGEARRVLDVILRKTYGFQKHQDQISLSQFVLSTQIKRPNVIRALNKLKTMKLIIQIDNEKCNIYRFNKDFDTWKSLSKQIQGVSKQITGIIQMDNESLSKQIHTKEKKETITKESSSLSYEDVKETFDSKAKTYKKLGIPYKPKERTDKQKLVWDTEEVARAIKDMAMEMHRIEVYLKKSESGKSWKALINGVKELGKERAIENARYYLGSEKFDKFGADVATMFSEHSINMFLQKDKIKPANLSAGVLKAYAEN